jgi:hypothetical protein
MDTPASQVMHLTFGSNTRSMKIFTFPPGVDEDCLRAFHKVVRKKGKQPTERRLTGFGKPFTQVTLGLFRDWLMAKGWAYWLHPTDKRKGWELNRTGLCVIKMWYLHPDITSPPPPWQKRQKWGPGHRNSNSKGKKHAKTT